MGGPSAPSPGYGIVFRIMKINRYQAFGGHLLGSIGVVAASLWLERVCRLPPDASGDPTP